MGDQNPWAVESIEAFSFYCCPECDLKTKNEDYFKKHAIECHNKSKVFFIMLKPGNNTNKDPLEVETEFEFQEENEKGTEKFGESETSVNEESLSESEGEVKKYEQTLIDGPDLASIDSRSGPLLISACDLCSLFFTSPSDSLNDSSFTQVSLSPNFSMPFLFSS